MYLYRFVLLSFSLLIFSPLSALNIDEAEANINELQTGIDEITQNIKEDSQQRYEFSANVIPNLMNADVENSGAASQINDTAYHFELSLINQSNKKDYFGFSDSTEAYFALHVLSRINAGACEDADCDWADHTNAIAFVYGHTYYLRSDYTGFAYGWYGGANYYETSDAYYWYSSTGTYYKDSEESGIQFLVAGTILYKYEIDRFFLQPRIVLSVNTQTYEPILIPGLMAGIKF